MDTRRFGAKAHKAGSAWVLITGLAIATVATIAGTRAWAQAPQPASVASDAPSESARRQALSPYRFILLNANAPARAKPAAAPEHKEVVKEAKRPAQPAGIEQAALQPRGAPTPALDTPASQPVPEPVAALTPRPAEPAPVAAVRREIIPIQTDEPRLSGALRRERPSGIVKMGFDVMPDGSTGNVRVVSSTNRALNKASLDAVAGWKFQPVDEVLSVETELAYRFD